MDTICKILKIPKPQGNLQPTSICQICGIQFYASPGHIKNGWGKYCSMKCRSKAFSGSGNGRWLGDAGRCECKACGIIFRQKPSHIAIGEGKYCSKECFAKAKEKIKKICPICGIDFWVHPSHFNRSVHCSKKCQGLLKTQNGRVKRECIICGKGFSIKKSDLYMGKKGVGSFCSQDCKSRFMSSNPRTVNGVMRCSKGGIREDLGIYVRSSWEANYARYLNFLVKCQIISKWEFEPDTFEFPVKRGSKFYTPDFKVFSPDGGIEYHEVKGYLDQKSITKIKRFKIYYPQLRIELIDSKVYSDIKRKFSKSILNWE